MIYSLLVCLSLAAGSSQERSFIVNTPYAKAVRSLQRHAESIDQDRPHKGVTVHTLSFTEDPKDRERVFIDGHFTSAIKGQPRMEIWLAGSIHETSEGVVFHFYSRKVNGPFSLGNAWIRLLKHAGGTQTHATVHLEIRATVPIPPPRILPRLFYRARMAMRTRIGNRIAGGIISGIVSQGLSGMESMVRQAVVVKK